MNTQPQVKRLAANTVKVIWKNKDYYVKATVSGIRITSPHTCEMITVDGAMDQAIEWIAKR